MNKASLALGAILLTSVGSAQTQYEFIKGEFQPFELNYTRTFSGRDYTLTYTDFGRFNNVFNTNQDIYTAFAAGLDLNTKKPVTGFAARWMWQAENGLYGSLNGTVLFQEGQNVDVTGSLSFGYQIKF